MLIYWNDPKGFDIPPRRAVPDFTSKIEPKTSGAWEDLPSTRNTWWGIEEKVKGNYFAAAAQESLGAIVEESQPALTVSMA